MAKSLLLAANGFSYTGNGATSYVLFGNAGMPGSDTTEVNRKQIIRTAGTVSNLCVKITANAHTVASTFKIRKGGVDGNSAASITASTTGYFKDSTNSDSFSAGDHIGYALFNGAGSAGSITVRGASCIYEVTSGAFEKYVVANTTITFATASVTRYGPIVETVTANIFNDTTEPSIQTDIQAAGVWSGLQAYVSANTRTATTIRSRVNSANGTQVLSIGASGTGFFEDTTNTDTLAVGDNINLSLTSGTGTNTLTIRFLSSEFVSTGDLAYGLNGASQNTNTPGSSYFSLGGFYQTSTESDVAMEIQKAMVVSMLNAIVTFNTQGGANTFGLRKNGANGNSLCSVPINTTGEFVDTSNTDSLVAGDIVNHVWTINGSAGGSLLVTSPGYLMDFDVPAVTVTPSHSTLLFMGVG